jgi:hypothetical protein
MKLENQVCPLDLAERPKESGVKPRGDACGNPGATKYARIFFLTAGK